MARRYTLKNGESSFNGIDPASVKFCGVLECGYHNNKDQEGCVICGKFTHYSLHRRYKWSKNVEEGEKRDRFWLCSDKCAQTAVFHRTFDMVIPFDVSEKIINWKGK